jgi:hypothetical protein
MLLFHLLWQSWTKAKPEFVYNASIRHIPSGKYLAVSPNNSLILSKKYNETCIFGVWQRKGKTFGLQSKYSRRWVGQNLLGSLSCSAYSFDRREEWDVSTLFFYRKQHLLLCRTKHHSQYCLYLLTTLFYVVPI